ncbi:FAD-dependent oxidoreductase [Aquabacterium sp. J223]|uniref:FAD-dependent oxidoreductase n=1 Tax=Aquabacterium sp. J223 TaxID=2898431 RepID=UPI0021AE00D5|nr:NAD(P)/FAD-dependent oxidoreductase [Aquabacterium sp. J223]UUX95419.1 FAD-dependent monooxygenase [Aquabacterium sp. J223]
MIRIAIAGCGVAGGVVASGLAACPGVELLAWDRAQPEDQALAGTGLNIGPNALLALRDGLPELAAALTDHGLPWRRWRASTVDGERLYEVPLRDVAAEDGLRLRWATLYRLCRQGAEGRIRFDTAVTAAARQADGRLRLTVQASDGGAVHEVPDVDLLLVADGRYSGLRDRLCGTPAVRHLGVANFRLLLDDGGRLPIDDMAQWHHGAARLIAFRLRDGLVYLSGNLPMDPGAPLGDDDRSAEHLRRVYLPADRPVLPEVRALLDAAAEAGERGALHWSRLQEQDVHWQAPAGAGLDGRVLFLGDAAHAMVPTLGQGATSALEDAGVLVPMLRQALATGTEDLGAVVQRYVARRQSRIDFIRRFSWQASDVITADGFSLQRVRDKGGAAYRDQLRRLYGEALTPADAAA